MKLLHVREMIMPFQRGEEINVIQNVLCIEPHPRETSTQPRAALLLIIEFLESESKKPFLADACVCVYVNLMFYSSHRIIVSIARDARGRYTVLHAKVESCACPL